MENKDIYEDISSIKNMMERSTRFISLSGLSGVMAGIYALIGAGIAYKLLYINQTIGMFPQICDPAIRPAELFYIVYPLEGELILLALAVLILSIATGIWLTRRKARRKGQSVWNASSKSLLKNGIVPLLTGGFFLYMVTGERYYDLIAPTCLVFYGLSLVAASKYTYGDVKWLGFLEILLGLICMVYPDYGLLLWALGFGVLHILYGTIMYFKYDRGNNAA